MPFLSIPVKDPVGEICFITTGTLSICGTPASEVMFNYHVTTQQFKSCTSKRNYQFSKLIRQDCTKAYLLKI